MRPPIRPNANTAECWLLQCFTIPTALRISGSGISRPLFSIHGVLRAAVVSLQLVEQWCGFLGAASWRTLVTKNVISACWAREAVAIPPGGLGQRHSEMTAWLDENCGSDGWAMTPSGMRGVLNDAISIYFAEPPTRQRIRRPVVRRGQGGGGRGCVPGARGRPGATDGGGAASDSVTTGGLYTGRADATPRLVRRNGKRPDGCF